jgi:hypothetical protein
VKPPEGYRTPDVLAHDHAGTPKVMMIEEDDEDNGGGGAKERRTVRQRRWRTRQHTDQRPGPRCRRVQAWLAQRRSFVIDMHDAHEVLANADHVDHVITRLAHQYTQDPDNTHLARLLDVFRDLRNLPLNVADAHDLRERAHIELDALHGTLSEEDTRILSGYIDQRGMDPDLPIAVLPPTASPRPALDSSVLPLELWHTLSDVYLLHNLATAPATILPPGKSLLSTITHANRDTESVTRDPLRTRVETMVHKAFWDEVGHIFFFFSHKSDGVLDPPCSRGSLSSYPAQPA